MSFISTSIFRGVLIGVRVGIAIALLWSGAVLVAAYGHWHPDDYFLVVFSLLFFVIGGVVLGALGGLIVGILLPRWEAEHRLRDTLCVGGIAVTVILVLCCILPTVYAVIDSCNGVAAGLTCDRP